MPMRFFSLFCLLLLWWRWRSLSLWRKYHEILLVNFRGVRLFWLFFVLLLFFFGLGLCFHRSLMLSWISLFLPSQWTSADFQTGKGMNRNRSNVFFEFFFPNNINFTAFYGYHPTITLWFSFISFNFLLWKFFTKMFRKNERFFTLWTNRQFPSSFSSLSCTIIRQITDVLNVFWQFHKRSNKEYPKSRSFFRLSFQPSKKRALLSAGETRAEKGFCSHRLRKQPWMCKFLNLRHAILNKLVVSR